MTAEQRSGSSLVRLNGEIAVVLMVATWGATFPISEYQSALML
jgi:hypothetical protein